MANFKAGDRVEYIDDTVKGVVKSVIDKYKVMVELEDGLEIPILCKELINLDDRSNDKEITIHLDKENKQSTANRKDNALLLAVHQNDSHVNIHLVNDLSKSILFTAWKSLKLNTPIAKGEIEAFSTQQISDFTLHGLQEFMYTFQILIYDEHSTEIPAPIQYAYKFKGKHLLKNQSDIPLLNQQGYTEVIYPVTEQKPDSLPEIKAPKEKPVDEVNIRMDRPEQVIDLHIDKICDDFQKMSREEILDYQFNYFINAIEKANALKYSHLIFIHGIGVNTLKNKIVEHLKSCDFVSSYKDADVRKYGFGATEVRF